MPTHACTFGLATIMRARVLVPTSHFPFFKTSNPYQRMCLVAVGAGKAHILHQVIFEASILFPYRTKIAVRTSSPKPQLFFQALCGAIDLALPASLLQLHPHVTVFTDAAAAAGLRA